MRIAFFWIGIDGRYGHWQDGLYEAMQHMEKEHIVMYADPCHDLDKVKEFKPDFVLFWEAPQNYQHGLYANDYRAVMDLPYKKALLFAGGMIKKEWVEGFDLVFVESQINEDECYMLNIPCKRAFGINERIFKPEVQPKVFDAVMQGTFASWKRQQLFSAALKDKGVCCGRKQATDTEPFRQCWLNKTAIFDELPYPAVSALINMSHTVVNTADYWGGGQRCTLEAMACGVPVIVMEDSPKNCEYVRESNAGLIVHPAENPIRLAVEVCKGWSEKARQRGIDYINSKWTSQHYYQNLIDGIHEVQGTH